MSPPRENKNKIRRLSHHHHDCSFVLLTADQPGHLRRFPRTPADRGPPEELPEVREAGPVREPAAPAQFHAVTATNHRSGREEPVAEDQSVVGLHMD